MVSAAATVSALFPAEAGEASCVPQAIGKQPCGSRVRLVFLLAVYSNPICGLKCSRQGCSFRIYDMASNYRRKGKLNSPLMFASINCRPELNTL